MDSVIIIASFAFIVIYAIGNYIIDAAGRIAK